MRLVRCHAQAASLSLFARHSHPASFLPTVDAYEHQVLPKQNKAGDLPPAFHEWATIQPGMIVLARKKRTAQYRCVEPAPTRSLFCRSALTPVLPLAEFTGSSTLQRQRCQSSGAPSALRRTTSPTSSSRACVRASPLLTAHAMLLLQHGPLLTTTPPATGRRRRCERPTMASGRRLTSSSRFHSAAW